jgi:ferritin
MIQPEMAKLLIAQLRKELDAHGLSMAIAMYFDRANLDDWGKVFHKICKRKGKDAKHLVTFLLDTGAEFDLPGIRGIGTNYESVSAAVGAYLAAEEQRSLDLNELYAKASELGDPVGKQWVRDAMKEQVERLAKVKALQAVADSGLNAFVAEELIGSVYD